MAVQEDGQGGAVVAVRTPAVAAVFQVRLVEVEDQVRVTLGHKQTLGTRQLS